MRHHVTLFIFLVIVVAGITRVAAQPAAWQSVGMGGGGALFSPSISPHDGNIIYLACDMSELFHTTDKGQSWSAVDYRLMQAGNIYGNVQFTDKPLVDYTISNANETPHPVETTNGGASWDTPMIDPTGGNAYTLIADHENSNIVLVADYNNLYVSINGGNSFTQKDTSKNPNGYFLAGACFNGNTICVGTDHGLIISTDGGSTFARTNIPGIPSTEEIVSFTGASQGLSARLFCVTLGSSDVYPGITGADHGGYHNVYSMDLGLSPTWIPCGAGIPTGVQPFFVSMAPNNLNVVYVAGGSTTGSPTVYKTTDGGASWNSVFQTSGNLNIATGWSGDGGDRGWSYGEYVLGLSVSVADVNEVAITDLGFAHLTTNGGTTWKQIYLSTADQNATGAPTPVGKAYHGIGLENTSCWRVAWIDSNNLYGCFSDIRAARSTDAGASWSQNFTGDNFNTMYYAVHSTAKQLTFAATSSVHDMYQSTTIYDSKIDNGTGQILFSADSGHTWKLLHDFSHPVIWLALDPVNSNKMYASVISSTDGGIYVCSDIQNGSASTWTKLATPPRTEGHPFNILILNDGTLVASYSAHKPTTSAAFTASSGVFISTNNGAAWIDRSDAGMQYWTNDVVVDPHDATQNTWYACVFSGWGGAPNGLGGVYKTTNRGVAWTRISNLDRVSSCTIHPDIADAMYLTTETNGLYYCSNLSSSTPTFTSVASFKFRQPERVFFNPYNHSDVWVTTFGNGMYHGSVVIQLPTAPTLLAPANASSGININDTLTWQMQLPTKTPYSFHLQVARDSGFKNLVLDSSGMIDQYWILSGVAYNTTYYWRVNETWPTGTSDWTAAWLFTTKRLTLLKPFKVQLLGPYDDEVFSGSEMPNRFVWQPTQPSIDRYEIDVATDSAFMTMTSDTAITDTSAPIFDTTILSNQYWWRVRGHNLAGWGTYSDAWKFSFEGIGVHEHDAMPASTALVQNIPNPFSEFTTLHIVLAEQTPATLQVCDLLGTRVATLFSGTMEPGTHDFTFSAEGLRSGVFMVRWTTPAGTMLREMIHVH